MKRTNYAAIAISLGGVSIACYALSLAMPAFRFSPDEPWIKFSGGNDLWSGLLVLILGWIGIFQGVVAWFANPAWLVAVILLFGSKFKASAVWAVATICLALTSFFLNAIAANEGGGEIHIQTMGCGFYVWLLSFLVLLIGTQYGCATQPPNPAVEGTLRD